MSQILSEFDVVIIGGGIGGLTLSLKLAQANIKVLVIEKEKQPGKIYKGELLQPKSLEGFQEMGISDMVVNESLSLPVIHTYEMKEKKDGSLEEGLYIPLEYERLHSQFPEARMIPHEKLKKLVLDQARKYDSFHYWNPATFEGFTEMDEKNEQFNKANVQFENEVIEVEAKFFVGAEGRSSLMRKAMNQHVITTQYNHQFLTVTFPRPENFTEARMYASHKSFIGLFPLPDNQVRSVMLIKPGEYKQMKKQGLESFYEPFERFEPALKDGVRAIESWKQIQLMIPIRHNINRYVKGNAAIIGDAAHTVHPMAGEGMNLAIQDAIVLGELYVWMFRENQLNPKHLKYYEKVRKKRSDRLSRLSHMSAIAYAWPYKWYQKGRMFALKRLERHPILHYKHMLNISGVGWWPYNLLDGFRFLGPRNAYVNNWFTQKKRSVIFDKKDDYPWLK
ncbi:FAD-dependent oxidoreductase [Salipaludibacillus keqinensis]|uniref:FAD-dependent oxidoreductase n=1 Tax=Salipaludibacillus keqinensis TaxID=2045207 RepID=A0A323TM33_9BACI|nr:NAD(P)/FAD-dependent oxidoreductase [Salipaludibacillus keqinensis]PYZ95094.1 FAD-dependent oxidoreductase [Salipaludibacillus keqinensis]